MMIENKIKFEIGSEYLYGVFASENSKLVKKAFKEISKINRELFKKIPYEVMFTTNDHYKSAKEMRERVQKEGIIYIFTENSEHPFLSQNDNNIGRAVHDVFAHLVCGCPFSFKGEYNAFLEQQQYYPEWTRGVLFAEIVGQTCAYYIGGYNFDQRAIDAPKEWIEMCRYLVHDYSKNSIINFEKLCVTA